MEIMLIVRVVMYCMRSQIQNMNEGGSIVNASSIAGIMGFPKNGAYTASKHGMFIYKLNTWRLLTVL
jgi:short-subunit dehydrogenase